MPKIKTHRGAAKRFTVTGTGKVRRYQSAKGHLLTKKSAKRKRALKRPVLVASADEGRVRRLLPYAF